MKNLETERQEVVKKLLKGVWPGVVAEERRRELSMWKDVIAEVEREILTLSAAEIHRVLAHALAREGGLILHVRNRTLQERCVQRQILKGEELSVSNVEIRGQTLLFCVGTFRYEVIGPANLRRMNRWLSRATYAIPKRRPYGNPDARIVFLAELAAVH